ncbi:MAG: hypothetical protein HYS98_09025 [Deltaproteobacteria bacterium]|nr:hypothetical protein [Deltaproteobacteria bacterium]
MKYLLFSFLVVLIFSPSLWSLEIEHIKARGTYKYSLTYKSEKKVKQGERKWYRSRDTLTQSVTSEIKDVEETLELSRGSQSYNAKTKWSNGISNTQKISFLHTNNWEENDHHFFGFIEGLTQAGNEFFFTHVRDSDESWSIPISYSLSSKLNIQIMACFDPDFEFAFVYPIGVDEMSVTITDLKLSETFSEPFQSQTDVQFSHHKTGRTAQELFQNFSWSGGFHLNEKENIGKINSGLTTIGNSLTQLDVQNLVPINSENSELSITLKNTQTLTQNADSTWMEKLAYRGILIIPFKINTTKPLEELSSEYFLSNLDQKTDIFELLEKIKNFQRWITSDSVLSGEDILIVLPIAEKLRIHLLSLIENSESKLRPSLKIRLFQMLNLGIYKHILDNMRNQVNRYQEMSSGIGQTMDELGQNKRNLEEIWLEVIANLKINKSSFSENGQEKILTLLENFSNKKITLEEARLVTLNILRGLAHECLETRTSLEGFIQKTELDYELLNEQQRLLKEGP